MRTSAEKEISKFREAGFVFQRSENSAGKLSQISYSLPGLPYDLYNPQAWLQIPNIVCNKLVLLLNLLREKGKLTDSINGMKLNIVKLLLKP